MNAPFRAASVDWDLAPASRSCADPRAFELVARLAAALANPFSIVPSVAGALPGLPEDALRKLASSAHFGRPLRRAAARALDFDALAFGADFCECLTEPAARLCVGLAIEPIETVRAAALDLAVAILHRRILMLVLKSDRAKLRAAIGEDALLLATQEAPLRYAGLASLDRFSDFEPLLRDGDEQAIRDRLCAFGMQALSRFIDANAPALFDLFKKRAAGHDCASGLIGDSQCDQILKLFRRRASSWSAFID